MKVECVVSCLVVVEIDASEDHGPATIEALAKHEFFCNVAKLNPDDLAVETLERAE